jgi:predicted GNAT family acetyltransferase
MELLVVDNADEARFEIREGGEVAGFVTYRRKENEISFLHVEMDGRFRGQGVGGRLVRAALDEARARELAVLPYCPFVRGWMVEHPEYADLVPAGRRAEFGL